MARTETLRPTGAGSNTNIDSVEPTAGDHWDAVNDVTADATTYVYNNRVSYQVDTYATANSSVGTGTIHNVAVYARCMWSAVANHGHAKMAVLTGGTVYYGSEEDVSSTWTTYSKTWANNPDTSASWTWAQVDAMEIGVAINAAHDTNNYIYCTQVYAVVTYSTSHTGSLDTATCTATFPTGGAQGTSPYRTHTALRQESYGLDKATCQAVPSMEYAEDLDSYLCIGSQDGGSVKTKSPVGASWTDCVVNTSGTAQPAAYLTTYQNRLVGLDYSLSGFRYSSVGDITTSTGWTLASDNFPNYPDRFHGLMVGRDANDDEMLYALTPEGLQYLDVFTNFTHGPTEVKWEYDKKAGRCGIYFKGDHYVGVNKGVVKFGNGVVTYIGPDQDDGLEAEYQGYVADMIGVGPWIVIAVNGSTANKSVILKRYITGQHWHVVHATSAVNKPIKALCWNSNTLYWGEGTNVRSCPFSNTTDNVRLDSSHTFVSSGEIEYPWFDGNFKAIPKVAHKLRLTAEDITSNESVTASYRKDDESDWTALGDFGTSGFQPTALSFGTNATGVEFERIQIKLTMQRGDNTGKSPKVKSLVLEYRVVPPVLWGWTFKVAAKKTDEKTGQDYITALETALDSTTLLTFYPTGDKSDTAKYVEIVGIPAVQGGGEFGEEGVYVVTVQEAVA